MVTTINGRKWHHAYIMYWGASGGLTSMASCTSPIRISARASWHSSRLVIRSGIYVRTLHNPPLLPPSLHTHTHTHTPHTHITPHTQASYWSSKKYEVHGDVYDSDGQKVRHLFGTWHEAMFCGDPANAECIWRAGDSHTTSLKWMWEAISLFHLPATCGCVPVHTDLKWLVVAIVT